jgi:hypothetical protein
MATPARNQKGQTLEQIARDAADANYRLPGEDARSATPAQIREWVAIYADLLAFKRNLLKQASEQLPGLHPAAGREVAEGDLVLLEAQCARCSQQLDYWRLRAAELGRNRT